MQSKHTILTLPAMAEKRSGHMSSANFLTLTYQSDEDRDPLVHEHESADVAEAEARGALPNLPDGAFITIARIEFTLMKETRIIKAPIKKQIPAVAGHAS